MTHRHNHTRWPLDYLVYPFKEYIDHVLPLQTLISIQKFVYIIAFIFLSDWFQTPLIWNMYFKYELQVTNSWQIF